VRDPYDEEALALWLAGRVTLDDLHAVANFQNWLRDHDAQDWAQ